MAPYRLHAGLEAGRRAQLVQAYGALGVRTGQVATMFVLRVPGRDNAGLRPVALELGHAATGRLQDRLSLVR